MPSFWYMGMAKIDVKSSSEQWKIWDESGGKKDQSGGGPSFRMEKTLAAMAFISWADNHFHYVLEVWSVPIWSFGFNSLLFSLYEQPLKGRNEGEGWEWELYGTDNVKWEQEEQKNQKKVSLDLAHCRT